MKKMLATSHTAVIRKELFDGLNSYFLLFLKKINITKHTLKLYTYSRTTNREDCVSFAQMRITLKSPSSPNSHLIQREREEI